MKRKYKVIYKFDSDGIHENELSKLSTDDSEVFGIYTEEYDDLNNRYVGATELFLQDLYDKAKECVTQFESVHEYLEVWYDGTIILSFLKAYEEELLGYEFSELIEEFNDYLYTYSESMLDEWGMTYEIIQANDDDTDFKKII